MSPELLKLRDEVDRLPAAWGGPLRRLVEDAIESVSCRERALGLVSEALRDLRLELAWARLDAEASRRELRRHQPGPGLDQANNP